MISFSAFIYLVEVLHELSSDITLRRKSNLKPFVRLQVFFLDWVTYMLDDVKLFKSLLN
jgi:hypothetical protein